MHDLLLRLAINRMSGLKPYEKLQLEDIVDSDQFFRSLTPQLLSRITGRTIAPSGESPGRDPPFRGAVLPGPRH